MLLEFLDMLSEEWTVRGSSNKGTKGIVGHLRRFEYNCGFFSGNEQILERPEL